MVEEGGAIIPLVFANNVPFKYHLYVAPALLTPVLVFVKRMVVDPGPQISVWEVVKEALIEPQLPEAGCVNKIKMIHVIKRKNLFFAEQINVRGSVKEFAK